MSLCKHPHSLDSDFKCILPPNHPGDRHLCALTSDVLPDVIDMASLGSPLTRPAPRPPPPPRGMKFRPPRRLVFRPKPKACDCCETDMVNLVEQPQMPQFTDDAGVLRHPWICIVCLPPKD